MLLAGKVWHLDVPKSHLKPRNSRAMDALELLACSVPAQLWWTFPNVLIQVGGHVLPLFPNVLLQVPLLLSFVAAGAFDARLLRWRHEKSIDEIEGEKATPIDYDY